MGKKSRRKSASHQSSVISDQSTAPRGGSVRFRNHDQFSKFQLLFGQREGVAAAIRGLTMMHESLERELVTIANHEGITLHAVLIFDAARATVSWPPPVLSEPQSSVL